jgi:hypothetical protein
MGYRQNALLKDMSGLDDHRRTHLVRYENRSVCEKPAEVFFAGSSVSVNHFVSNTIDKIATKQNTEQ